MTDQLAADDVADIDGDDTPKKKMSVRTLALFIGVPVLLAAGVGGAFMMGVFGGGATNHGEIGPDGNTIVDPSQVVFYELPELIINLQTEDPRGSFVKFKVTLELHDKDLLPVIEPLMPRIIDNFQIYLRELRAADLEGSAGLFRLKEEILRRINIDIRPYEVADVLFTEMIVQ